MRAWVALAVSGLILAGCNRTEAPLGRWVSERFLQPCEPGLYIAELREGGELDVVHSRGTWRVDGDRVIFTWTEDGAAAAETSMYRIEGDRLRGAEGRTLGDVLVRCGSPAERSLREERRRIPAPTDNSVDPLNGIVSNQL